MIRGLGLRCLIFISRLLNCVLKLFFGHSLHSGSNVEKEKAKQNGLCVQRSRIWIRGKMDALAPTERINFLLTHLKYEPPESLLNNNASLLTLTSKHAIFAICPDNLDVYSSNERPFVYITQFEKAYEILTISLEDFIKFGKSMADPKANLILLSSTGRCGSTLLTQMMEMMPKVITISEPDAFVFLNDQQLLKMPESVRQCPDDLFLSVIRVQCKSGTSNQLEPDTIIIKTRSQCVTLIEKVSKVMPKVRHVFMHRDPEKTILSFMAMMFGQNNLPQWMLRQFLDIIKSFIYDSIQFDGFKYSKEIEKLKPQISGSDTDFVRLMSHMWLLQVLCYQHFAQTVEILPVKYEDLLASPLEELNKLFDHCGISKENIHLSLKALDKDSQKNSRLSKDKLDSKKKSNLTQEEKDLINADFALFDVPPLHECHKIFQ